MTATTDCPPPPDGDLFTNLVAASVALVDTWIGPVYYQVVPITEVRDGDVVLPAGWPTPAGRAIALFDDSTDGSVLDRVPAAAETLDDGHVRVYWNVDDRNHPPVDCWTVFGSAEKVLVAR